MIHYTCIYRAKQLDSQPKSGTFVTGVGWSFATLLGLHVLELCSANLSSHYDGLS